MLQVKKEDFNWMNKDIEIKRQQLPISGDTL